MHLEVIAFETRNRQDGRDQPARISGILREGTASFSLVRCTSSNGQDTDRSSRGNFAIDRPGADGLGELHFGERVESQVERSRWSQRRGSEQLLQKVQKTIGNTAVSYFSGRFPDLSSCPASQHHMQTTMLCSRRGRGTPTSFRGHSDINISNQRCL